MFTSSYSFCFSSNRAFSPEIMAAMLGYFLSTKNFHFFCFGNQHGRYTYCLFCLLELCKNSINCVLNSRLIASFDEFVQSYTTSSIAAIVGHVCSINSCDLIVYLKRSWSRGNWNRILFRTNTSINKCENKYKTQRHEIFVKNTGNGWIATRITGFGESFEWVSSSLHGSVAWYSATRRESFHCLCEEQHFLLMFSMIFSNVRSLRF